jgi:Arc/MetJ-type ribon-helix-helix transcriptional regulator
MKVSVSLSDDDVEFLDAYAQTQGLPSRSAAVHKAVRALAALELADEYESAWDEWAASGDADAWEHVLADGMAG